MEFTFPTLEIYNNEPAFQQSFGSSSAILEDFAAIIGGFNNLTTPNHKNIYLQIKLMSTVDAKWLPLPVDTNGLLNRSYHATISMGGVIYMIGGCVNIFRPGNMLVNVNEIIKIERVVYGIRCSLHSTNDLIAKQGMSANTIGKQKNKSILFGGLGSVTNSYSSDTLLFDGSSINTLAIDKSCEVPPPRAYHSSAITGENSNILIIFGGITNSNMLLNDLWILDISEILLAAEQPVVIEPVIEQPAKGGKPAKGKEASPPKEPSAYWIKVITEHPICLPRYMHNSFALLHAPSMHHYVDEVNHNDHNLPIKYFVFGGLSKHGIQSLSELIEFNIIKKDNKFILDGDPIKKTMLPKPVFEPGSASASRAVLGYDDTERSILSQFNIYSPSIAIIIDSTLSHLHNRKKSVLDVSGKRESSLENNTNHNKNNNNVQKYINNSFMIIINPYSKLVKRIKNNVIYNNPKKGLGSLSQPESIALSGIQVDYPNGDVYRGEVIDVLIINRQEEDEESDFGENNDFPDSKSLPHGQGIMNYHNGDIYEGHWENGIKQGTGKFVSSTGIIYEGEFSNDDKNGNGVIRNVATNIIIYDGLFSEGSYHGYGTLTHIENGDIYEGEFINGVKHGNGSYTRAIDNAQCKGIWKGGQLSGVGFANGMSIHSFNVSLGHNKDYNNVIKPITDFSTTQEIINRKELKLDELFRSKTITGQYTGPLLDGIPSGPDGKCKYVDGSEYVGEWKSGRRNGVGLLIFSNLDEYDGKWVGDKRCGYGRLISKVDCYNYEGNWMNNVAHGEGRLVLKDESEYCGKFVNGKREGYGKHMYDDGTIIYEGLWTNDRPAKNNLIN
eukprot:gene9605-12934_t